MLRWALIFFVISIVSGIFAFTTIAAGTAGLAKITFFVTGIVFLIFLTLGLTIEKHYPEKL